MSANQRAGWAALCWLAPLIAAGAEASPLCAEALDPEDAGRSLVRDCNRTAAGGRV